MHLVETAKQKRWWHCTLLIVPVLQLYSELLGSLLKYKIILLSMTLWQRCVCMWKFKFLIWSGEKWSLDVQVNRCKVKWDCSKQSQWVDHPSGSHRFTKMLTSAELVENISDHHLEHSFSTFHVPSHDHQTTQFSETFSRIFYV